MWRCESYVEGALLFVLATRKIKWKLAALTSLHSIGCFLSKMCNRFTTLVLIMKEYYLLQCYAEWANLWPSHLASRWTRLVQVKWQLPQCTDSTLQPLNCSCFHWFHFCTSIIPRDLSTWSLLTPSSSSNVLRDYRIGTPKTKLLKVFGECIDFGALI